MKPVFAAAKKAPKRVIFCEGEDERVLRAVQTVVDEGWRADPDRPPRGGREAHREARPAHRAGSDFELVNPDSDPRYKELWQDYHELMERQGVSAPSTPSAKCAAAPR
jgi:malate dehydrogenase (oxaloacetate-decarboxylating)(NADP+)